MQQEVINMPPLKIAIIGCGNIMQALHFPILKNKTDVEIRWLVDTNKYNLKKATSCFPAAHQTTSVEEIEGVDAVIIATPPGLHFEHVKFALIKGLHVLVEKPLSTDLEKSRELVALAEQRGLNLCVNLNRRFFPNIQVLKNIIDARPFGSTKRIKVIDGDRWTGGAGGGTTYHSSVNLAGGGVMLETGSHMVDLAFYLLPSPSLKTVQYADDGTTGLEAECRFSLGVTSSMGDDITIEGLFSSIAPLSKKIEVQFERATVKTNLPTSDLEVSGLDSMNIPLFIPVSYQREPITASFRNSLKDFIKGCQNKEYQSIHRASSALLGLKTIDQCYRNRKPLPNPWGEIVTTAGTTPLYSEQDAQYIRRSARYSEQDAQYIRRSARYKQHQKKIIGIIGAGGFLGSRLFERLLQDDRYTPRAISYSSLGSFAALRHTDTVAIGDARSPNFLRKALEGVDVVVNCAINMNGTRRFAIDTTRAIAKNAAQIARELEVKRFVQISTIAVHGVFLGREGDPLRLDPTRSTYALAKYFSEQEVLKRCKKSSTDSVILRIGHIYGPYAAGWTVGQRDLVRSDTLVSIEQWYNPSNTVFVDNAIDAIIAAIEYPSTLNGTVFYITDIPNKSWREFYEPLFALVGKDMTQVPDIPFDDFHKIIKHTQQNVFRQCIDFTRDMVQPILEKGHLQKIRDKRKYQKLFNTIENIIPEGFFRYLKKTLNRKSISVETFSRDRILDGIQFDMARSYASSVEIPTTEAVTKLGYRPSFDSDRAQQITIQWLKSLE